MDSDNLHLSYNRICRLHKMCTLYLWKKTICERYHFEMDETRNCPSYKYKRIYQKHKIKLGKNCGISLLIFCRKNNILI